MKFRDKLIRFMQGRNGTDDFARFCSGFGFGLLLIALVFTIISSALAAHAVASVVFRVLYWVFYLGGLVLCVYSIFRAFSRNVGKRQAENTRYLYQANKVRRKWEGLKERWRNRNTYKYFRCPKCKQQLRAPRNKGKIRVTCHKCGEKFIIKT